MSSEERKKILQMVQDGRISAEQAASLMQALAQDEDAEAAEPQLEQREPGAGFPGVWAEPSEFDEIKRRARRFAMIPLWVGIFITALSAWGIYSVQQSAGINFWFFCLMAPFALGILLIMLGAASENSKWLYVNVDRHNAQDWPRNITLGFPLPLGLAAWILRTFGHYIQGLEKTSVDDIIQVLHATGTSDAPLIVNANDDEDGEHVQVYIG